MLEYVDDIEDCVQDLLNTLGVERKHEINMQIVQDISRYIARMFHNESKVFAIVGNTSRRDLVDNARQVLERMYPSTTVYEFFSSKIKPEKIIIFY
jgi:precorrin-6x reductase